MPMDPEFYTQLGALAEGGKRMEKWMADLVQDVRDLKVQVASLQMKEAERGALEKAGMWLAGTVGAVGATVAQHVWK